MRNVTATAAIILAALLLVGCGPQAEQDAEMGEGSTAIAASAKKDLENGEFTAELNGFEMYYVVRGKGPVCMVMPVSWGMSHEGLAGMLTGLEDFLTVVYFDPRGLGRSADIEEESDMSMAAVREDFDALRRFLGLEKVTVLGWSNGGQNAMLYAAEHPDAVEKLILLHTVSFVSQEDIEEMQRNNPDLFEKYSSFFGEMMQSEEAEEVLDTKMRDFYVGVYMPALFYDFEADKDAFLQLYDNADLSWKHARYNQTVDGVGFDAREQLSRIEVPTLVVAGKDDLLPPEKVDQYVHQILRNSVFAVLYKSGHFSPIEQPQVFLKTIRDFLEN